jgi:hypothetical protein
MFKSKMYFRVVVLKKQFIFEIAVAKIIYLAANFSLKKGFALYSSNCYNLYYNVIALFNFAWVKQSSTTIISYKFFF